MSSAAWIAGALLLASAASTGARTAPQEPEVRCATCKSEGRLPCAAHERGELHLEDGVAYCSVIAGCTTCGGAGWLDCAECEHPKWPDWLEAKRARVAQLAPVAKAYDTEMKRPLCTLISDHVALVWEVERMKVEKRTLGQHELAHLYSARLERLYTDYTTILQVHDREFRERAQVFVWANARDQVEGASRFAGQQSPRGVKLLGGSAVYSVCGDRQSFKDDETLHRNLVHNVAHLWLAHQAPSQWIGNLKCGWADEGLAHYFEEKYFGLCDNYCYEEQNTNVDFKGGRWKPVVRKMVATGDLPSAAEVMQHNTDGLTLPMHALAFSYVDYLIATDGAKFNLVCRDLRGKVATRDALEKHFGLNLLVFEERWKTWVLATYPAR